MRFLRLYDAFRLQHVMLIDFSLPLHGAGADESASNVTDGVMEDRNRSPSPQTSCSRWPHFK